MGQKLLAKRRRELVCRLLEKIASFAADSGQQWFVGGDQSVAWGNAGHFGAGLNVALKMPEERTFPVGQEFLFAGVVGLLCLGQQSFIVLDNLARLTRHDRRGKKLLAIDSARETKQLPAHVDA